MIRNMVMGLLLGLQGRHMKESGRTGDSMELDGLVQTLTRRLMNL